MKSRREAGINIMKPGVLFGGVAVLAVGVMVALGVRVLYFFEKQFLSVMALHVECLGVSFGLVGGDIFDLVGVFVAVVVEREVDDLELEVRVIVRLVWDCLNRRLYCLWRLSRMSLERKISNVGGHPFGMVMRGDFFYGSLLF